jgi:hypothetical protein
MDKFCFGCAKYWKEEMMTKVKRGKATRLMCQNCLNLTGNSWYSKGKKDEGKKVVK